MKIEKVLNNNAVIAIKDKQEVIIIGRGIAFQKHIGDKIDEHLIEKIFTLENEDIFRYGHSDAPKNLVSQESFTRVFCGIALG
ncbi:CAT RNA binding domain-containing protein [Niallia sp. JL1B1071]|uniref:CAT RNA binding domain-containing protein n=1 Tax=Niallia tiangongensis TaxID=3237105 RepID=UPI0037DD1DE3